MLFKKEKLMDTGYVYFNAGDIVMVKHAIDNRPKMLVVDKVSRSMVNKEGDKETTFIGIKCRWFSEDGKLQEAIFSTKDLMHI